MNTRPDGMQRRQPRKAEILVIAKRLFPDADILDDLSVRGLRNYIAVNGRCEISGKPFMGGRVDYDHKKANALSFKDDKIEWQVLHPDAHKVKTKADRKKIAKADRMLERTGQVKRRKERKAKGKRPLIQSNPKLPSRPLRSGRGFGRSTPNVKQLDEL
jgi:hypothetical protein